VVKDKKNRREAPQDSALESKKDSDYADYGKIKDLKHYRESRIPKGLVAKVLWRRSWGLWRLQKF